MMNAILIRTIILPGNRIEVTAPDFPEGKSATVFVVLDEAAPAKRPLRQVLGEYEGGQLFRSAEEVDAHLKAERESWE